MKALVIFLVSILSLSLILGQSQPLFKLNDLNLSHVDDIKVNLEQNKMLSIQDNEASIIELSTGLHFKRIKLGNNAEIGDSKYIYDVSGSLLNLYNLWTGDFFGELSTDVSIDRIAFSKTENIVAVFGEDILKLYDLNKMKEIISINSPAQYIKDFYISPCENYLMIIDELSNVFTFEIETGNKLYQKEFLGGKITFSKDSLYYYVLSYDGILRKMSLDKGEILNTYNENGIEIIDFKFSNVANKLFANSSEQTLYIYEEKVSNSKLFTQQIIEKVDRFTLSTQGKLLYIVYGNFESDIINTVTNQKYDKPKSDMMIDTSSLLTDFLNLEYDFILFDRNNQLFTYKINENTVEDINNLVSSPDGNSILVNNELWDIGTGKRISNLPRLYGYEFDQSGKYLLGSENIYNTETKTNTDLTVLLKNPRYRIAQLSSDLKFVAFAYHEVPTEELQDEKISLPIYDVNSSKLLHDIKLEDRINYNQLDFSPDGRLIAFSDGKLQTNIFDLKTGGIIKTFKTYAKGIKFSPKGKYLTIVDFQNIIKIYNTVDWTEYHTIEPIGIDISKIEYNYDEAYLLLPYVDRIEVLDINHKISPNWEAVYAGSKKSFSSDGKYLLILNYDGQVSIIDIKTAEIKFKTLSDKPISKIALTGDNKYVLAITEDKREIQVYDFMTGDYLYTRVSNEDEWLVFDSAFRFDGSANCKDLFYYTCGQKIINDDQTKSKMYVPNLVKKVINRENLPNTLSLNSINLCNE